MRRSPRFGVSLIVAAAMMVLVAILAFAVAGGDVEAIIEYSVSRKQRRGGSYTLAYPAWVVIVSLIGFAIATAVAGLASIRGSTGGLAASAVLGALAAIAAWSIGFTFGQNDASRLFAAVLAVITLLLSVATTIAVLIDVRNARARAASSVPSGRS